MKSIIAPVNKKAILAELTDEKFIRKTNNGGNELFVITSLDSPNIMREIGRLREITFRAAGGGTGKDLDIDKYDISDDPYRQLIVWDPDANEILGGYRFFICHAGIPGCVDPVKLATSKLFTFSDGFVKDYLPYMIELGRSFVQPDYQSTKNRRKGLYALDNLWDGLGAIVVDNPLVKYFFGKVTMYTHYHTKARDMILYFLNHNFPDIDKLVIPINPLHLEYDNEEMKNIFTGENFKENYRILSQQVRSIGETIPPLINAYMNLSHSLRVFGTVLNEDFGGVEETAMMITIQDLYASKVERHIDTYTRNGKQDQ